MLYNYNLKKMKKKFVLFLIVNFPIYFFSQTTYKWIDVKNANPDTIFSISFEKQKLNSLPNDLFKFTHLKKLDLSKNKLTTLPEGISNLIQLEEINLGKNYFTEFPEVICNLIQLKTLIINRNEISSIPNSIVQLNKLESIDMWDTPIENFPESFISMKNLKYIDARGVTHGPKFQKLWIEKLPWVKIEFDAPCNCFE